MRRRSRTGTGRATSALFPAAIMVDRLTGRAVMNGLAKIDDSCTYCAGLTSHPLVCLHQFGKWFTARCRCGRSGGANSCWRSCRWCRRRHPSWSAACRCSLRRDRHCAFALWTGYELRSSSFGYFNFLTAFFAENTGHFSLRLSVNLQPFIMSKRTEKSSETFRTSVIIGFSNRLDMFETGCLPAYSAIYTAIITAGSAAHMAFYRVRRA